MNDDNVIDMMAAKAAALDAAAQQQATPIQLGQPIDTGNMAMLSTEIDSLLQMVVSVLTPALPSLREIYTSEVTQTLAETTARVCVKHGWLQDGIGGKYAEEIALAAVALPIALATYSGIKGDIAKMKQKNAIGDKTEAKQSLKRDLKVAADTNTSTETPLSAGQPL